MRCVARRRRRPAPARRPIHPPRNPAPQPHAALVRVMGQWGARHTPALIASTLLPRIRWNKDVNRTLQKRWHQRLCAGLRRDVRCRTCSLFSHSIRCYPLVPCLPVANGHEESKRQPAGGHPPPPAIRRSLALHLQILVNSAEPHARSIAAADLAAG
jgi:hypothetical protein